MPTIIDAPFKSLSDYINMLVKKYYPNNAKNSLEKRWKWATSKNGRIFRKWLSFLDALLYIENLFMIILITFIKIFVDKTSK